MNKKLLIYLSDEFADWEGSFLLPELKQAKIPFQVVSEKTGAITSIGGLRVTIDHSITEFTPPDISGLILIGAETWTSATSNHLAIILAKQLLNENKLVAAICGATFALAREGLLDQRPHTSNDLKMLKHFAPNYKGESSYQNSPAVAHKNLITASGTSPIDFTYELMKYLNIYDETKRQHWYNLYKMNISPPDDFWY